MVYVFIAGALGFLVFDAYRIKKTYSVHGRVEITIKTFLGFFVHLFVYIACGVLGIFVNIDVLGLCCDWAIFPEFNDKMLGLILRSFALGLAGPAGISKGQTSLASTQTNSNGMDFGEITVNEGFLSTIKLYFRIIFMR